MIKYLLFFVFLTTVACVNAQGDPGSKTSHEELIAENKHVAMELQNHYETKAELAKKIAFPDFNKSSAQSSDSLEVFLSNVQKLEKLYGIKRTDSYLFKPVNFKNTITTAGLKDVKWTLAKYDSIYVELIRLQMAKMRLSDPSYAANLKSDKNMISIAENYLLGKSKDSVPYYESQLNSIKRTLYKDLDEFVAAKSVADNFSAVYPKLERELLSLVKTHGRELSTQVENEKRNYRENGPDGFSEGYYLAFPNVHPQAYDIVPPPPPPASSAAEIEIPDHAAEFPGGINEYMNKNLVIPASAAKKQINGKVYVKLLIRSTGEVSEVSLIKGIDTCPECNEAALNVLRKMPDWLPGMMAGGRKVNSYYTLPVQFKTQ